MNRVLLLLLSILVSTHGFAGSVKEAEKLPVLYKSENTWLRELSLSGNLQWQWAAGESNRGSYGTRNRPGEVRWGDVEGRRIELGFRSQWGDSLRFSGHIDPNIHGSSDSEEHGGIYRDIHDLSISYTFDPVFVLGIGKVTPKYFAYEDIISSREMAVMERSLVVANLIPPELTGIRFEGKKGRWKYGTGFFSGEDVAEFSGFNQGLVFQNLLGYDAAAMTGLQKTSLFLSYQYSSSGENDGAPAHFQHALSWSSVLQDGPLHFYSDLLAAHGRGEVGDIAGLTAAPSWYFTDQVEVIFRYQYAIGSQDALRLQSRYERLPGLVHDGYGNRFEAAYLGVNYYLNGHGLKLMSGVEYQNLEGSSDGGDDFEGVTALAALRMSF